MINLEAVNARVIYLRVAGDSMQNKNILCVSQAYYSLCETKDCTRNNKESH